MDIDRYLTGIDDALGFVPNWAVSLLLLGAAFCIAVLIHRVVFRIVTRLVSGQDLFWRSLVSRTAGPTRLAMVILALALMQAVAPLSGRQSDSLRHGLLICFIALCTWMIQTALHIWTTVYLRRFKLDADDNLLARKHVTQTRILRRVGDVMIVIVGVAAALMTFESVQQYGVSLLASAGAAGLVVGLALQPVLKNLFAGVQLAVTQPIRIDDALLVEGEWGRVEEITATYVVVRIWDLRRMILPLSYFIEQPFQNWTRETSALIGTVMIYLDYSVPIEALRRKVQAIVEKSPNWDRDVVNVQVTDFKETTVEVRILVSASGSGRAFDLRCEVREALMTFLQDEYPEALPRVRMEFPPREPAPGRQHRATELANA